MSSMFNLGGIAEHMKMKFFNFMLEKNKPKPVPTSGIGLMNYCMAMPADRQAEVQDLCVLIAAGVKIINRLTGDTELDLGTQVMVAYPPATYNFKNEGALDNYSKGYVHMQMYPTMVRLQKTGDLKMNISEVIVTVQTAELMTIHNYLNELHNPVMQTH